MESGFRFRFVALSFFAVEGLCPFTFRLVLSWQHACPCPSPCPPTFWTFPTPPHPSSVPSILASHPYLCSRRHHHTLQYLPLPHPFLRPFISRHPSASGKPVPKDSSRAAVTYYTFLVLVLLFYIYNIASAGCIYCTYILVRRIFFRCVLGVDMRNSNCTFWTFDLVIGWCVHWQDQCCHRDPTVS